MNLAYVGDAAHSRRLKVVEAAGWPAVITVACAGITAGFFTWYGYLTHGPHGALMLEATLVAALVLGPLLALILWDGYARYFAHRTDIAYAVALRWDVPSWAALVLLWLILA